MSNYKLEDFVDIESNVLCNDANDVIAMCKRHNNAKRDFLFVNKKQAKHIATSYDEFSSMTAKLYNQIITRINPKGTILIIGFAETATAIAADIMRRFSNCKQYENNDIWFVQTTRQHLKHKKYLMFQEEHSHATEQRLYWDPEKADIDTVIIIDDEITTGNTVINMMKLFKKFYPKATYACASVLNWQNDADRKRFAEHGITATALITGKIKDVTPKMDIENDGYHDGCKLYATSKMVQRFINRPFIKSGGKPLFLEGCNKENFKAYMRFLHRAYRENVLWFSNKKYLILGTEECMYQAIVLSKMITNSICHATTRSPITVHNSDDYFIKNEMTMNSNYGDYEVHLYNIPDELYDEVIMVTDTPTRKMNKQLQNLAFYFNIPKFTLLGV